MLPNEPRLLQEESTNFDNGYDSLFKGLLWVVELISVRFPEQLRDRNHQELLLIIENR